MNKGIAASVISMVLIVTVSEVKAGTMKMNFDSPGLESVQAYVAGGINGDLSDHKEFPEPQAAFSGPIDTARGPEGNRMFRLKDLLKELSPMDRVEFVSNIDFFNRKVSSQGYDLLLRTGSPEHNAAAIVREVEGVSNAVQDRVFRNQAAETGGLLLGLPEHVKLDLADSLKFINGSVVSVKTDLLERTVSPEIFEEIISKLMPERQTTAGIKVTTRLKDHACWASTGAKGRDVLTGCSYDPGYTCSTSSCK